MKDGHGGSGWGQCVIGLIRSTAVKATLPPRRLPAYDASRRLAR